MRAAAPELGELLKMQFLWERIANLTELKQLVRIVPSALIAVGLWWP